MIFQSDHMTSLVCHMKVLWSLLTPSVPHDVIYIHVHDLVYPNQNLTRDLNLLIIIVIIIIITIIVNHIIHDLVHDQDHLYHLHIIIIINDHNHQQQQIIIEVEEDLDHHPLIDLELEMVYHHNIQKRKLISPTNDIAANKRSNYNSRSRTSRSNSYSRSQYRLSKSRSNSRSKSTNNHCNNNHHYDSR